MKHNMNRILTTMALLVLTTMTTWAEQKVNVTVTPANSGSVTYAVSNGVCTLTANPADGYYITVDNLKAVATLDGGAVQSPRRRIDVVDGTELEVTPATGDDPSGTTTYTIAMPEDANLNVEVTAEFQARTSIEGATVTVVVPEGGIIYTGEEQNPAIASVVLPSGVTLTSTDYTVAYSNNINVGNNAEATVVGQGKYKGSATGTFSIGKAVATVTKAPEALNPTYTGAAQNLVTAGETENGKVVYSLSADGEFTETIPQATAAGSYTVYYKATGDANHSESAVGNVAATIVAKSLTADMVDDIAPQAYTGEPLTPAVRVTDGDAILVKDQDYEVSYSDNVNVGENTAKVTITGKGNYTGSVDKTFSISAVAATVTKAPEALNPTYTGSAQDLVTAGETENGKVVYSLSADGEFTETIPQATDAGSYTVYYKATGDANHSESAVGNVIATIAKADFSTVTIGAIADQTFTGAEIKPAVTVTFNAKSVSEDEYNVAYSDNVNAGTATVTLTSKDKNFSTAKRKTATFKINPAEATLSFDKTELSAAVNETPEWPVLSNPQGANVAYTSSKPEVAEVDKDGLVTMKGTGTTIITAVVNDPNYQGADASYKLIVTSKAYKLKIDGIVVTDDNREDLFDKSVMFDGVATLTLTKAHISGIESGLDALEIYVIGDNIIESETAYAIWDMTGGEQSLYIYTDMTEPGRLELYSKTQVVSGFKEIDIKEPMTIIDPDYMEALNEADNTFAVLGTPMDPIVTANIKSTIVDYSVASSAGSGGVSDKKLTNVIVDNVLYTLDDKQEPGLNDDGYADGMLVINSVTNQEGLEEAIKLKPGSPEYANKFKGVTFMVPAGFGEISFTVLTKEGHALCVNVGGYDPRYYQSSDTPEFFTHNYCCTSATYVYIYHVDRSNISSAPAEGNHRIGPKATVSTGVTGLSVKALSVDTPPKGMANYLSLSRDDLRIPEGGVGHIVVINDKITDLNNDAFADLTGATVSAPQRASRNSDITYIDLRGTSITGKEFSREEGPFKGLPETTFVYLPAGNEVSSPNMVVGSVCKEMSLGDENRTFECAEGGFTAGRAVLERWFPADEKYPIYVPFEIKDPEKYGMFFEYNGISEGMATMKKTTAIAANTPYYLQAKEGGVDIIEETGVNVNPVTNIPSTGLIGTYKPEWLPNAYFYDNETKMFQKGADVMPFEAYLNIAGSAPLSVWWEGEKKPTAVETITVEGNDEGKWYSLDGRQLQQQPVEKGIYLKNGKKYIVK